MCYPRHPHKNLPHFSPRSMDSGFGSGNNPASTIKPEADNSKTRLVVALVGISLLFGIYLYFFFRPIIKDKNCIAPYESTRHQDTTVTEDLEKGMGRPKSDVGEKRPLEADEAAAQLEKRKLHQWLHRASLARFLPHSRNGASHDKERKAKKRKRQDQIRSKMPTICVSPPPPVYGSNPTKADPICYLSDSHNNLQDASNPFQENVLIRRPTHTLLVPAKAVYLKQKHCSLIQSPVLGNDKNMNATRMTDTGNTSAPPCPGGDPTKVLRSFTM